MRWEQSRLFDLHKSFDSPSAMISRPQNKRVLSHTSWISYSLSSYSLGPSTRSTTFFGMQLYQLSANHPNNGDALHLLRSINLLRPRELQQRKPGNPKICMKNINHIPRSIRNSTSFRILTLQNKLRQLPAINPMQSINHLQTAHNPPTITHILEFFRASIQTSCFNLPLTQPSA
jgi:hypothetical protein